MPKTIKIPTWIGVLIILSPFIIGGLIAEYGGGSSHSSQSSENSCSSRDCVLKAPTGGESVVLAASKQALNEMMASGSDRAIAVMVLNGSAFLVLQNTSVSVVDRGFGVRKVLVLEGPTMGRVHSPGTELVAWQV
ncbi:MAG: hypothetical protein ACREUU_19665, partial [Gammaproteobacteria bacterium]